ncbi:MAG: TonB-dependent receptor, partial [Rhizomicrobium sp.]
MRTKQVSGIGKRGLAGTGALAAAAAGILLLSDPVSAQTAPAATEDVETVVVTGSHITTPGFEAPTPVTSLSDATIKQAGALNAQALETQIPQLAPNVFAQQSNGNPGQSTFNLRNLGTTRTLLLLDGQRLMPTSYDGSTDANIIPLSLIKRFDVVTGGASAAYGSDAVAGVVNIVLDNDYEGLKGNVQAGESQYHDNKEFDASLTGGVAFDGGRGHLVVSGEIYGNGGSDFGTGRRPWARQGWWEGANPNYVAGVANGQTQFLVMPNALFSAMTNGGLIDTGPLKGIYFGPGGAPQAMTYGKNVGPTFMQGGSGDSIWQYGSITPVLNRASIYTHASYDIAPDLSAWTGVMYVHSEASSPITPNYQNSGAINVSINNPYLPASIVALMNADHVTSFGMGRMDTDLGFNEADGSYSYLLWRGGLKGTAFDSWSWDLTGQYSTNDYLYKSPNNENVQHFNNAVNVVTNPANGLPICASTLVTPGDGCIPTNIFGPNTITPAERAYIVGTSWNRYMLESWDFVGNVQGVLFKNWAGDVSLAAGGEVRRNSLNSTADPGSIAKIWRINNVQPFRGAETDEEGYIESDVPLLKGLAFVKSFDIDGAYRYTNYDISGKAETWKIGANYAFDDDLRFRLTTSRDIRAPNLNDLFSTSGSNVGQAVDYQAPAGTPGCAGLTCNETINYGTGGNINLKPEVGLTITGGVVYSPSWLDGFQASVDYWQIHLHNAITSPGPQTVIDQCMLYHVASFCPNIIRGANGLISFVGATEYNTSLVQTNGVDFEADYTFPGDAVWSGLGSDSTFTARTLWAYTDKYNTTTFDVTTPTVGTGNLNKWRGNVSLTYATPKMTLGVMFRYVGAERYSDLYTEGGPGGIPNTINTLDIGSRFYFNVNGEFQIPNLESWRLFAKVDNVFNVSPPVAANGIILPQTSGAGSQVYDQIGRYFGMGLRFAY